MHACLIWRSERLARARVAAEAGDGELTFVPAINDRSLRLALVKEIRELRDRLPASARLADGSTGRAPPRAAPGAQTPCCWRSMDGLSYPAQGNIWCDGLQPALALGSWPRRHACGCAGAAAPPGEEFSFAPAICPASERLLEDSAQLPAGFLQRQRHFHDLRQRRLRALQAQVGSP
jgi:hypothetical protein